MAKLIIVESGTKAKKIQGFLGSDYMVKACYGHVQDLPARDFGIDMERYRPVYELTDRGKKIVASLRSAARNCEHVYLATDPDREGEAIAAHLFRLLKLKQSACSRITYQEVTKRGVLKALGEPRQIDGNMVDAQEARRVLDRILGYTISPALMKAANRKGLSAGRVQSPALRLVVERDRRIEAHNKQMTYGAILSIDVAGSYLDAEWVTKPFEDDRGLVLDRKLAEKAASASGVVLHSRKQFNQTRKPPPPYTTSVLQQAANGQLGFSSKRTMDLAQKLFEQGFITYHRTDSVALSEDAINAIRAHAREKGLPVPDTPNVFSSKADAQEAHEAIRPTDMDRPLPGDPDESKLYQLIYRRTLASQLKSYVEEIDEAVFVWDQFRYRSRGRRIIEPGFLSLSSVPEEVSLPDGLVEDSDYVVADSRVTEKETRPPPAFTEGTLVKKLESLGIGRPSTYASILANIQNRGFIESKGKKIVSTDVGRAVVDALSECKFLDYGFTKEMEAKLDDLASGKPYYPVVDQFWSVVRVDSDKALQGAARVAFPGEIPGSSKGRSRGKGANKKCPECGNGMVKRKGPNGEFLGCSTYPNCKKTLPVK